MKKKIKENKEQSYIKVLGEILTKIEGATEEKNTEKAAKWYYYLQGFIKASMVLTSKDEI